MCFTAKPLSLYTISESEVVQSCLTLCDPMDCSLPGPSIHGIFQARILEWVTISSPEDLSDHLSGNKVMLYTVIVK